MPLFGAFFFGFVPMFLFAAFINWLDRYEKEPKILLGAAFGWGALIAAGGAFVINTASGMGIYALTGSQGLTEFGTSSIVAPVVEESLKGLAVLIVFFFFRWEFDSVMDGIVYAAITAMGFAATENVLYIYRNGFLENGWSGFWALVFIRVVLVGWMHPFFTSFTGIGLAVSRTSVNTLIRFFAVPIGFAIAVFAHAFHNTFSSLVGGFGGFLAGTAVDYLGYVLMFGFILWMILRERKILQRQLPEEVAKGYISRQQYDSALSFFQISAYLSAMTSGSFLKTARFYQVCGELAHKKDQFRRLGDETGNRHRIEALRSELIALAPAAKA
ncbi:MAG: PrsW family intramembrane metalloprotease [Bacteroidota bacterium]